MTFRTGLVSFYLVLFVGITFSQNNTKFSVKFNSELESGKLDGRVFLMISTEGTGEPRFQINDRVGTQQIFGVDVEGVTPGEEIIFDNNAVGYPVEKLSEIPEGEYFVQILFHKYETFVRSDGHTVKLPMDRGEGQQWNRAPGNLISTPKKIKLNPNLGKTISLEFDQKIPPIPDPVDTKYIKHIKMKSELLSEFWGREIYLGAFVLLPQGFDEHPEAKYPLAIFHGHFPSSFGGFSETPADTTQEPVYSSRFNLDGYNITQQKEAHQLYKDWTSPNYPRMLVIQIQHPTPYYDDSYAVNSENNGPYGDAITYELIPYIEKMFRGIGEGWSRFLYGGSTGGWEALAVQVFYPDEYNGCFAACPDPVDFRSYMIVDLYNDMNAFYKSGPFTKVDRPAHRDYLGKISSTIKMASQYEMALGSKGRSGQQLDIWQAVYSPVGEDGYPKEIWDKESGKINKEIAEYWKENYDLRYILERDWETLGPKLEGKINVYCGDMDNYYLNNAVYLLEEFLESTTDPYYGGEVAYGDRAEHCWNGDPNLPNAISRLRYIQMYAPRIEKRILESAPEGADLSSWRY
ncbi:MAG: hypothetical protein K9I99_05740 [Melioribacteraceae bacterium]|nr:hypothetical protein [Melioribacteraceae bacterium]MCF8430744.1 hypothetical protein [Melioribacteraceae bacterium]